MTINTLATATIFQTTLDALAVQESVTGWMDANAGQVKYTGGKDVKIPKMNVQGMGNYDREEGYKKGSITLEYETKTMTQDRGRMFHLDPMEVDEAAFIATASSVMAEFQRTQVIPEIDAFRLSKLATTAINYKEGKNVVYGYTPAKADVISKIKLGIKSLREGGWNGSIMIHATYDVIYEIEEAYLGKMQTTQVTQGGITTQVPSIDGCPIIPTQQNRMYTSIAMYDGATSGQLEGGYTKGTTAKEINFMVIASSVPIALTKQDVMRIFDPMTNQKLNAWQMDYRRFHDLWTLDNKEQYIYVNIKDTKE